MRLMGLAPMTHKSHESHKSHSGHSTQAVENEDDRHDLATFVICHLSFVISPAPRLP